MRPVVLLVLVTGCRSLLGFDDVRPLGDAAGDTVFVIDAIDAPDGPDAENPLCFGSPITVCLMALPTTAVAIVQANLLLDTGSPGNCATTTNPEAAGFCVVAGTSVTIQAGSELSVFGTKPLVLLATTGDLTINGKLDAGSEVANPTMPGPGADPLLGCSPGTNPAAQAGGQGGSLAAIGGNGGQGNGNPGGVAGATPIITGLRGGCPGADSATTVGGHGGGAVLLISTTKVHNQGSITASGAGGNGALAGNHGGGGGGSGGMIVIEAPVIENPGQIWANGGSGGGGSNGGNNAGDGAQPQNPTQSAQGGSGGGANGGKGGNGSLGGSGDAGANGSSIAGGGGGGGGTGIVHLEVPTVGGGQISPDPT